MYLSPVDTFIKTEECGIVKQYKMFRNEIKSSG
jgi:hypothetical protein